MIHRAEMPQINGSDMTSLVEWLAWNRIDSEQVRLDPNQLRFHQKVFFNQNHPMPEEEYERCVLVSGDNGVLDGNHRARRHQETGEMIDCVRVNLPFCDALQALFTFAGTYREKHAHLS